MMVDPVIRFSIGFDVVECGEKFCVLCTLSFAKGPAKKMLLVAKDKSPIIYDTYEEAEEGATEASRRAEFGDDA